MGYDESRFCCPSGMEGAAFDDTLAFFDGDELVSFDLRKGFGFPIRPADLDVGNGVGSQAKMEARVIRRQIAGLAHHFLRLGLAAAGNDNA